MREMTKTQLSELLAKPNANELLAEKSEAAFPAAFSLFAEDGDHKALGFLCRLAKKKVFAQELCERLDGTTLLTDALCSENAKLRKNAARLIGELNCGELAEALCHALEVEEMRFVRPTMILALGALGNDTAKAALLAHNVAPAADVSEEVHFRDETIALKKATAQFIISENHEFTELTEPMEIELRCADKLSGALISELEENGIAAVFSRSDRVRVKVDNLDKLYKVRSFKEALFPLYSRVSPHNIERVREPFIELIRATHSGNPPYRFRIELKATGVRSENMQEAVAALSCDELLNSPSDYEIELRIEPVGDYYNVYAKLFTYEDTRFDYRKQSVSASIHPAVAAAVLRYAKPYFSEGARVLDPFCGSGTMLFERERLTACTSLSGIDISQKAVDAARENCIAASSKAKFVHNDCLRFTAKRKYDELISNLPFGNRVGNHDKNETLYRGFIAKVPEWLNRGGILILYTMEFTLLKQVIRESNKIELVTEAKTEAGGLMPGIFICRLKNI